MAIADIRSAIKEMREKEHLDVRRLHMQRIRGLLISMFNLRTSDPGIKLKVDAFIKEFLADLQGEVRDDINTARYERIKKKFDERIEVLMLVSNGHNSPYLAREVNEVCDVLMHVCNRRLGVESVTLLGRPRLRIVK